MEIIETISLYILFSISGFIIYELLKQLGFWIYLIELIYTNPKFDTIMYIVGDILYGISIGLLSSVGFNYFVHKVILYKALSYAIIGLLISSILKEYMKKEK